MFMCFVSTKFKICYEVVVNILSKNEEGVKLHLSRFRGRELYKGFASCITTLSVSFEFSPLYN